MTNLDNILPSPSAGDLRELPRVPLRGEGSCGGGGAPRDAWRIPGTGEPSVYGVAQSQTRLKRLNSSSSSSVSFLPLGYFLKKKYNGL